MAKGGLRRSSAAAAAVLDLVIPVGVLIGAICTAAAAFTFRSARAVNGFSSGFALYGAREPRAVDPRNRMRNANARAAVALVVELLAEPFYLQVQHDLDFRARALVEGVAIVCKTVATGALLVVRPEARKRSGVRREKRMINL